MTPVQIGINGALGRMGRQVLDAVRKEPRARLSCALERAGHPQLGKDVGLIAAQEAAGVTLQAALAKPCDVLIDFTTPESSVARAREAAALGIAHVIATTGFTPQQRQAIAECAARVPVLMSPNFSVGVNFLFALAEKMAATLKDDFDIEVVEMHHNQKVDAPSGTALGIAEHLARGAGWPLSDVAVYGREGQVGARPRRQIGIHTVRGGDVVGDHRVIFAGDGEMLEISHRANSRAIFATGALRAALFLARQKPGLYSMADLFK